MLALVFLGCMSISIGRFSNSTPFEDGTFAQEGEVNVPGNGVLQVFYPAPYASPPNLTAEDTFNHLRIVEQTPGYFRVENTGGLSAKCCWKARGVRAAVIHPDSPAGGPPPVPPPPLQPPPPTS